jgi:hypothetical protein
MRPSDARAPETPKQGGKNMRTNTLSGTDAEVVSNRVEARGHCPESGGFSEPRNHDER